MATEDYPKDTIGYHYVRARAVFGEGSAPVKWLKQKAQESPNGMNEQVVAPEEQVLYALGQMWLKEQEGGGPAPTGGPVKPGP